MRKAILLLSTYFSVCLFVTGQNAVFEVTSKISVSKTDSFDYASNHLDSLNYLIDKNLRDSLEKVTFKNDFSTSSLENFFGEKGLVNAWRVCIADDSLRKMAMVLRKTAAFLNRNPSRFNYLKNEINGDTNYKNIVFLKRTWWADSLRFNFDSLGNSSSFKTFGINPSDLKKSIIEDMKTEAAAPQFVESIVISGSSIPKKIVANSGYTLYKIIPKGNAGPSLFTPFWAKIDEIRTYIDLDLEQKFGLPIISHSAKYDVYKIVLKEGKTALVFESEVAQTTENEYKTTGGAIQSLVLDRSKWTSPELVKDLEIFPSSIK
ncbi:hypothetical protein [Lacihabitans soyangensis]|uniref:Uncharacterized protein n=1 Tax=Lacihabitans soyangensis TaxID=869394 RepID=A0AAE3KV88_9BACT|nr:hypothetical protein [Lacihabitans soyangensis]MCP9765774.1 hypothetical protein [Lacihabitans soyangensis]